MFNVKCLNPIAKVGLDIFSDEYTMTEDMDDADLVLVRSAEMKDMEFSAKLDAIARAGAGVNNIPLDRCAEEGIVVFNTPGANANGVKELVIAGMLVAARNLEGAAGWITENSADPDIEKSVEKGKKQFAGHEIAGKKIGVIGLGAIGVRVANACVALGMDVYGYDPYISITGAWNLDQSVKHVGKLDEIYSTCDFITVHIPATADTKGMIGKEAFKNMKKGMIVLNFARGTLVNDDDMAVALEDGTVAKYVTDFPNPKTAGMKNVIAIPHLGASTEESEDNCAIMAVRELRDFAENGNIKNSVNFGACDMGVAQGHRVSVIHKNQPNMIAQFTKVFGENKINIANMVNSSKGDYAYSMFDCDDEVTETVEEQLAGAEGVVKVRVIK